MLETEIKKLTAAVTRLADLMDESEKLIQREKSHKEDDVYREELQRKRDEAKAQTAEKAETEKSDPQTAETESNGEYTTDDIKSMALAISRKDRTKQKDIKAKLAEHDAKVAADLKGDGLQEVGEWLSALKEEMGA